MSHGPDERFGRGAAACRGRRPWPRSRRRCPSCRPWRRCRRSPSCHRWPRYRRSPSCPRSAAGALRPAGATAPACAGRASRAPAAGLSAGAKRPPDARRASSAADAAGPGCSADRVTARSTRRTTGTTHATSGAACGARQLMRLISDERVASRTNHNDEQQDQASHLPDALQLERAQPQAHLRPRFLGGLTGVFSGEP